ncbi:PhoD-like phosphatase-domain-containing protein [Aspergillus varians]
MVLPSALLSLLALSPVVIAGYGGNLNYCSPSLNDNHVNLGINTDIIHRRSLTRLAPSTEASDSNLTVSGNVPLYNHENEQYANASAHPICVEYRMFSDKGADEVVDKARAFTSSDIEYTVKFEATGLKAFTPYWYRFNLCGSDNASPLARTKTLPSAEQNMDEIKLAVPSCSNYPEGYFNAYGNVAPKDSVEYAVHLGDYIYEYESGVPGVDERAVLPQREIFSLYDYRTRLGQYRTDQDLVASHQKFPWITVWDGHEIADNGYRNDFTGLRNTEDSFLTYGPQISVNQRKLNAVRAYFEWMPIRKMGMGDGLRVWRNFQIGNLLNLIMINKRNYNRSITDIGDNTEYIKHIHDDAGRSSMGARQENWFYHQLSASNTRGAKWRVIGNQIVFAHLQELRDDGSLSFDTDSWTAYQANQNRTLKHMYDNGIVNNINIAGDSHVNWVSDMIRKGTKPCNKITGERSVGIEFASTAVSSIGMSKKSRQDAEQVANAYSINPELKWVEGYYRGYFELHLRQDEAEARCFGCPTVSTRNSWELPLANWTVKHSESYLERLFAGVAVEAGVL